MRVTGPLSMAVVVLATILVALLGIGQLGLLAGDAPTDLGVTAGRLKAPSATDNSVSSQARLWEGHPRQLTAMIAALPLRGTPAQAIARLRLITEAMPGASVVTQRDDYLYVRFTSRWLGFVDDTEFWADPQAKVVQVRSASRMGRRDFGVNRQRIERIRSALQ